MPNGQWLMQFADKGYGKEKNVGILWEFDDLHRQKGGGRVVQAKLF